MQIDHLPDPRVEAEAHYYNAKHSKLTDLGLEPHLLSESLVNSLINIAIRYRDRIDPAMFAPQVNWRVGRNPAPHCQRQSSRVTGNERTSIIGNSGIESRSAGRAR